MRKLASILAAAALAGAASAPAAAQYYGQPYPPGYYGNQGTIGAIIDSLLGNRYSVTDRGAVRQCAQAAVNQAYAQYGQYNQYGYNPYGGYNQPYGGNYGMNIRVTAITDVDRRSNGLRVEGLLDTGRFGYDSRYTRSGDLTFRCNVDWRGYVTNVRVRPSQYWRRY
jgi:hypothetical protein